MKVWLMCLGLLPIVLGGDMMEMIKRNDLDDLMKKFEYKLGMESHHSSEHSSDEHSSDEYSSDEYSSSEHSSSEHSSGSDDRDGHDNTFEEWSQKSTKKDLKMFQDYLNAMHYKKVMDAHDEEIEEEEQRLHEVKKYLEEKMQDTQHYLEEYKKGFKLGVVKEVLKMCQCDNEGLHLLKRVDEDNFGKEMLDMPTDGGNTTANGTECVDGSCGGNSTSGALMIGDVKVPSVKDAAKWYYKHRHEPVEQFEHALKGTYELICVAIRSYIEDLIDVETMIIEKRENSTGPVEP